MARFSEIHASITPEKIINGARMSLASDEYTGWCADCGDEHDGIEPDTHHGECQSCGVRAVIAAEMLLLMGYADED